MVITAFGPLDQEVLGTLTRSPEAVVTSRRTVAVPLTWHTVSFDGLSFSIPPPWYVIDICSTQHVLTQCNTPTKEVAVQAQVTPPTPQSPLSTRAFTHSFVLLNTDTNRPLSPTTGETFTRCQSRNEVRLCFASLLSTHTNQYGSVNIKVFSEGEEVSNVIRLRLTGSGLNDLRILDSIRAASG